MDLLLNTNFEFLTEDELLDLNAGASLSAALALLATVTFIIGIVFPPVQLISLAAKILYYGGATLTYATALYAIWG